MSKVVEIQEVASMGSDAERSNAGPLHVPVLVREVVAAFRGALEAEPCGWIVDGTLGLGGHAAALLSEFPEARLLGVDQDPSALAHAHERLAGFGARVRLRRGRISQLASLVRDEAIGMPVGFLFDLGVSSLQLDRAERGFSFHLDGPLDMRMDPARDRDAAEIVNQWDESDLADLFYWEGGETRARKIAHAIVESRRNAPFLRTGALADLVARTLGGAGGKIHPATKTFQALRRAVNEEGEEMRAGLAAAGHWLDHGGRLAVISFHSGEDREAKRFFAAGASAGRWKLLTRKPLEVASDERRENPRSRSARLRAAVRVRPEARVDAATHDSTDAVASESARPSSDVDVQSSAVARPSPGERLQSIARRAPAHGPAKLGRSRAGTADARAAGTLDARAHAAGTVDSRARALDARGPILRSFADSFQRRLGWHTPAPLSERSFA